MIDELSIRRILEQDRVWAAYALADLQPAFAPYCQWVLGKSEPAQGVADGVVLLFTALTPPIVFTMGPVAAVRDALRQFTLPKEIYLTVRQEHYPILAEQHNFEGHEHPMQRMIFRDHAKLAFAPAQVVLRLGAKDAERLQRLYALGGEFAPGYFDPYQLEDGVYFGVEGDGEQTGELVAAGGTHILARQEGIAAIGNMYTRANQRGKGHASAILQAIVVRLLQEGFQDIFLNVDLRNIHAHRLYQRYGFVDYCQFMEGRGVRK